MENTNLPSDHVSILFTDQSGISHEGIYNSAIHAFVEKIGDEGPEDSGITYAAEEIRAWEYLDDQISSDPDIIDIL
ncbi:hypothetical protein [Dyadobacter sp. CY356]|uniref:hypothetical protein n=1 Tax=Dyadobacter sp. CY356 TaxID=2906442 RepID=UPI001F3B7796|nr:hypothetical protein [Dyadobacter sp. CY356]MCF0054250.1 hypothetical protein [Dyadobacter sp. CY356]